jgi:nitroimidazol reductase NimA-like FMN-containing flavoprotein (pyridoxamine 5'-phosphate oxidase superfamily)
MEVPVRDDLSVADLHAMVKKTLAVVNFAVLATAEDAVPSPVFYAHDSRPAIYWGSSRSTAHSRYVEHTGHCSFVIVNTTARSREYRGVYARAAVQLLEDPVEMENAFALIMDRREELGGAAYWSWQDFKGGKIGLYEALAEQAWVNMEFTDEHGLVHDRRILVPLPVT